MWFRFSVEERWAPQIGDSETLCGPETGMLGRFHSCVELVGSLDMVVWGSEDVFGEGAPPMMPPSMNLMAGAEAWKREAISRELRGEMAFKSR